MAAENKPKTSGNSNRNSAGGKGNKRKYLAYGKPARKGAYPLRPGIEGFFLTCDGGRERQATNEALNLLDSFYEELVQGGNSNGKHKIIPDKPLNKKVIFKDSDSSSGEDEDAHEEPDAKASADDNEEVQKQQDAHPSDEKNQEVTQHNEESEDLPSKKQRTEEQQQQRTEEQIAQIENAETSKADEKHIDELIEDELKEIGDRNKRRFVSVDSGCNGVAFIRMNKKIGDPGPAEIVQHLMTSAASTRKHMSRFILRLLPAELTCYASEEEILKAIDPLIIRYFPSETATPQKFAVLYEARANTGVDRMKIINAVAKAVPEPHKVDLNNPDKTIIVEIAKTVCSIGVVERYKELSKYNLRQLTSPQK